MITLQSLTKLQDGRFYAKWYDADDSCPDIGHTVAALHHADGRLDAANLNIRAPRLTAEQMSEAQPEPAAPVDVHPAYALADLGIARHPDWTNRYLKAAELVEAGHVRLTGPETAEVQGSSDTYQVNGKCHCRWTQFHTEPCSHAIAVRMARALGLPIGGDEAARERAHAARVAAQKEAEVARIAARGENQYYRQRRQARHDGDGARQWARMAYANGRTSIPAHIHDRATGGG